MKRATLFVLVLTCALATPSYAQNASSSWGVIGTFVPEWHVPANLELVAALHFSEDELTIAAQNLKGTEFRVGVVRGRAQSGDWGVSFVRRAYEDTQSSSLSGGGCQGGGQGAAIVLNCLDYGQTLDRRSAALTGVELHKFIPFGTIARRVQIGLNLAGGIGAVSGDVTASRDRTNYTCTYPPGVTPQFDPESSLEPFSQCAGATIGNVVVTPEGSEDDEFRRFLKSESNMLPIGRVELSVAAIVTPNFKVRVSGGLNYPGINVISVTGVFFFGAD